MSAMHTEYIEKIKNKIIEHINNLTEEEIDFIVSAPELLHLLIHEIVRQNSYYKAWQLMQNDSHINIPEDIKEDFFTLAEAYNISLNLVVDQDMPFEGGDNSRITERSRQLMIALLKGDSFKIGDNIDIDDEKIIFLLNNKIYHRFDEINKIPSATISDETYNKFINEYPNKNKNFLFIIDYKIKKGLLEDISIEDLMRYFNYRKGEYSEPSKNQMIALRKVVEELNNAPDLSTLSRKIDWKGIHSLYYYLNEQDLYNEFVKKIYNKGYVIATKVLLDSNSISKDEIKQKLLEIIKSKQTSRVYLRSITNNGKALKVFDRDEEIVNGLIENDYLDIIFEYFSMDFILSNLERIKNSILAKKSTTYLENLGDYLGQLPPELLTTIIDNVEISRINILIIPVQEGTSDIIIKLITKNVVIDNVYISSDPKEEDIEVSIKLIENGYATKLIPNINKILTNERCRQAIIEEMKRNPIFCKTLLSKKVGLVIENDEFLDIYLTFSDDMIAVMLNHLNHNEQLTGLYSHKLFHKLKAYFCRKYNYNQEKLELIENHFGPNIIRFIDNENIMKILNLPIEEIQKILNLFPNTEYTLDDIRASYESLVQYSFAKNKPIEYSMFATLMHAIQDNNQEKINECKVLLLSTIDDKTFEKICNRYNISKLSLDEYFDYTVNQIISGNNRQQHKDNLHNLVSKYIDIERTKYRNNHYFDSKYNEHPNLYENIIQAIKDNNQELLDNAISILTPYLDDAFYEQLEKKYDIEEEFKRPYMLMKTIFEGIAASWYQVEYLVFLKTIINYYYEQKRNQQIAQLSLDEELELPYFFDPKVIKNFLEKKAIFDPNYCVEYDSQRIPIIDLVIKELKKEGKDENDIITVVRSINDKTVDHIMLAIQNYKKSLNYKFEQLTSDLYKAGAIPMLEGELSSQSLQEINLKNSQTDLYSYLKLRMPDLDCFLDLEDNYKQASKQLAKEKFKKLIPIICKKGRAIINDKTVTNPQGQGLDDLITYQYLQSPNQYFFRINGKDISIRKIIHDTLKEKLNFDDGLYSEAKSLIFPSAHPGQEVLKTLTANHPIVNQSGEVISPLLQEINNNLASRKKYIVDRTELEPYEILANLNLDVLRKTVLQDEEVYQTLIKIMRTKKIHLLPQSLDKLLKKLNIDLSIDASNIAGFISYFATILDETKTRCLSANKEMDISVQFTTANLLVNAEKFGAASSVFNQLLTPEDARLIKSNPKPNQAVYKLANNERLKEAVALTIELFQRKELTVPPFEKQIELNSGKKLTAICGNFTSSCNLTHGERNDSCMRIGGVGESLFNFILKNKNGFHIRFENPENHEYVSRVSGFRNGNTVFLNELRFSCSKDFSSLDVVDACKKVAKELIEQSKDSSCPIENVVISDKYAMEAEPDLKPTTINIKKVTAGLGAFYTDVDNNPIILATTAKEGFTPVNLAKNKVPIYLPLRSSVQEITDEIKMISKINRICSIKAILNGTSYTELPFYNIDGKFLYGLATDDWFIYVNDNLEIKYDIVDFDSRARNELSDNLLMVQNMISENKIQKEGANSYGM